MRNLCIREVLPKDWLVWERMRYALWPGDDETHGEVIDAFFRGQASIDLQCVLLATIDNTAVGFAELSVRADLPGLTGVRVGYIEGLFVEPAWRNAGIARALLRASRAWAAAKGCARFASDRDDRLVVDPYALQP